MPTLFWQDLDGQTVSVKLDSTQGETHEDTVTITDHPVERGISVTDHAKDEPIFYSVEGFVSNIAMPGQPGVALESLDLAFDVGDPRGTQVIELDVPDPPPTFSPSGLIQGAIGAIGRAISGKPKATVWGPYSKSRVTAKAQVLRSSTPRNRPKEVYDLLLQAKSQHALITVVTPFREHSNLMIQRLAVPRSLDAGQALSFQIDLRQIKVADSETVQAPVPTEKRGFKKVNAGAQAKKDKEANSEEEEGKLTSTLARLFF